jgi:UDP-glucose 4-epimerase
MKILVTGGAGFIGSHVIPELLNRDYEIICTIRKNKCRSDVESLPIDLVEFEDISKLPTDIDQILHLASFGANTNRDVDQKSNALVNSLGTLNLLEYARRNDIKKFVYASSWVVYGESVYLPMDENHPISPVSYYGASKWGGEGYCNVFREIHGLDVTILRICYVYGPRMHQTTALNMFVDKALRAEDITLHNGGLDTFDFVYIKDIVRSCTSALGSAGGDVYNIGSGEESSITNLAEIIFKAAESDGTIIPKAPEPGYKPHRRFCSIEKAKDRKELNYEVQYDLEKGIKEFVEYKRRENAGN